MWKRCFLAVLAVAGCERAYSQLRVFLAATGATESQALTASPALENPQVSTGELLYIYAQMFAGPEAWNGLSLDIKVTGGGVIDDCEFYNYANDPFVRWDYWGSGTPNGDATYWSNAYGLAYSQGLGVQNYPEFDGLDLHYRRDVNATLLGWLRVLLPGETGQSDVFLGVGSFGISKAGTGQPQDVYFGFGDENGGLKGNSFHQFSSLPDATVVKQCQGYTLGDADCSQAVDGFDIAPFVLALTDPDAYAAAYPNCNAVCTCDVNQDGGVDGFDIAPFVECLTGGCP